MRASGLDDRVLASIEHLLERPDEWFTLDAWGIARLSLRCHLEWHTPAPGREKIRALDLERRKSPIHAIREHARRLAEHGIGLLVVPVPTRLEVYPDRLPDVPAQGQDFSGQATGTTAFLALLVAEGIEVVDLLPRLVGERDDPDDRLYFDQNNHWTPRGAAVAARAVAQQLADMEGWTPGPARERIDFVRKRERGDEALYAKHEPPPETVIYRSVLTPDGQPAHERDRQSPLLLLGDSCTMQFKDHGSDLASLLYAETGWRVDTITFSSGASRVWHALARRHDGLSGKRWVVWIFNSRALALKEFKTYDLFPE